MHPQSYFKVAEIKNSSREVEMQVFIFLMENIYAVGYEKADGGCRSGL
jgi:hypothetical protein